ncbi:LOW QUALITY PROTEIN: peptidase inhibitor 16-like [Anoplopoma fimbria]|uniref:LOW QUALITY PROTEIN: peptidase inhibitor 16-like n=1 Tax=Anoplopoma fimbria TaxID=229290 RepID=UPI0023EB8725|nr:LOW QUALITY PROTEIN: peptidase inhibitor 16-like [Anoplopoma fimbria]
MHQRSLSELQGVSNRRTSQDGALRSSRPRKGSGRRCLPAEGAPLWAWLLLGALVVPGAWSYLSEEQEELLVELHNYYRGQVSPTASAMLPLRWDPSLKVIAEGYAAKCIWNHNPDLEDTGENLFAGTGPPDLRDALEKWFLEHLDYNFHNNSCDEDKMCGHYTQMVWADTHRVGCAIHLCNNMEGLDWERVSFLVCNYYPAGNYEDQRPFVEGEWCSRCPENLQKCENNLCVPDSVDEGDEEDEEEEVDDEDEVNEEEGTDVPLPGTSAPSLQPEEEEEEEVVVPPSATTELYVPPATTPAPASTPSITTTTTTTAAAAAAEEDSEDPEPTATPDPGTHPPEVPPNTPGEEETTEEKMEEKKEEEKRKDTSDVMEGKEEIDVTRNIYQNTKGSVAGADSASSPFLLLACLTGILTLRL